MQNGWTKIVDNIQSDSIQYYGSDQEPNTVKPKQHQPLQQVEQVPASSSQTTFCPIGLKVKLLIGFSVVFSVVFAGAFYWFYNFTTYKTIARLRADMRSTLEGAIARIDEEELIALYQQGDPNEAGFSNDPRYFNQLAWFQTVHTIEPRAWLYSYIVAPASENRRAGAAAVNSDELEIVYLVDLWALHDPSKAAGFLESDVAGVAAHHVYRNNTLFQSEIYQDKWGEWMSASAPIGSVGEDAILVLGLDIEADYVSQVQQAIRQRVLIAYIITYAILFVLIYTLSEALTKRLSKLTQSAERISSGNFASLTQDRFPDELNRLAQVFEQMVNSIRNREQLIREGKQAEDEMRLALKEEREVNELKSRFVSMVSHELRTPLTILRTSLELLERYGNTVSLEKRQEYFQRSRISIAQMTQLLEDVLTIGRAEAGKLEFKPLDMDVVAFCRDIAHEIQVGMGMQHQIRFQSDRDSENAELDPNLLRSILTNLLSNAVKYSSPSSSIHFHLSFLEDWLVIEVTDSGIGIPQEDQALLFELFHRASNVSAIRGTGVGLAIVRQCVAHHRGRISFTSEEGEGTTFVIKLPRKVVYPGEWSSASVLRT